MSRLAFSERIPLRSMNPERIPVIRDFYEFASLFQGVRPGGKWGNIGGVTMQPICHSSAGGASMMAAPGPNGGILATCWACVHAGSSGWYTDIENRLGKRVAFVMPDGNIRWVDEYKPDPGVSTRGALVDDIGGWSDYQPLSEPLNATALPSGFTMFDFAKLPVWFPITSKKDLVTERVSTGLVGWRQSRPEGMRLARYGGDVEHKSGKNLTIRPWRSRAEFVDIVQKYGWLLTFGMGGDADCPADHDIVILDCDYKPDKDETGKGKEWRDAFRQRCERALFPCISSSSGNGFHVIGRLDPLQAVKPQYRYDPFDGEHGIGVDVYYPSAKRQVVLQWQNVTRLDQTLPVCSAADYYKMLRFSDE